MGAIAIARAELAAALGGLGAPVTDHVPERLTPPTLMVVHGSPFIESGDTFGTHLVRFEVWAVSKLSANARMTDDLDALVESAIGALIGDGWQIENVAQPFAYSVNNASYLASTITVTTTTNLNS